MESPRGTPDQQSDVACSSQRAVSAGANPAPETSEDLETQVVDDPDAVRRCGDPCPRCGITLVGMAHVCPPGPATTADLLELDAVPEPTDSDAPQSTFGTPADPKAITQKNRRTERP